MKNEAQKKTEKEVKKIEAQINSVYGQAQKEIEQKIKDFDEKFKIKKDIYYQKYKNHEINQKDYNSWLAGQKFQAKEWKAKRDQICGILHNANAEAVKIVNGGTISVFADSANWTAYKMEHGEGVNFGFGLYNAQSVTKLMKDNPQIAPKWKIDEPKEYNWNKQKVNNCITQGIIQGEGMEDIAKRVATVTSNQNKNLAMTHTQTALGAAQNAGTLQRLQDAKSLGINVVKMWMATLDKHTRDSHAEIDGEEQPVGDMWHPMKFSNGCRYPCDPLGPAHEVFNCRCVLVEDIKDYPEEYQRYDNIDGEPIENMTYAEWEKAKEAQVSADADIKAKETEIKAAEDKVQKAQEKADIYNDYAKGLQQEVNDKGADHVFKGIWKDNVTYADYYDKKDSIDAKKDYYNQQIEKYDSVKEDRLEKFADNTGMEVDECKDLYDQLEQCYKNGEDIEQNEKVAEILDEMGMDKSDLDDIGVIFEGVNKDLVWAESKLDELEEFEKNGPEMYQLLKDAEQAEADAKAAQQELKDAEKELKDLNAELKRMNDPTYTEGPFGSDAYSQERKDAALWAKSPLEADHVLRPSVGEVWKDAPYNERKAAYDYTAGSGGFNRPLRGYEDSWTNFKGVGNVSLDNEGRAKEIEDLTKLVDKTELPRDTWLQRGVSDSGLAGFLDVPESLLQRGSQKELEEALLDKVVNDPAFMSYGSSKGQGFSGNIINTYCPEGTKAIYAEPFSEYGRGAKSPNWDGKKKQVSFGSEDETILQRNTYHKITKVELKENAWGYRSIFIDTDVVDQRPNEIKYN